MLRSVGSSNALAHCLLYQTIKYVYFLALGHEDAPHDPLPELVTLALGILEAGEA